MRMRYAVVAVALSVSACGTTVQQTGAIGAGQAAGGSGAGNGLGAPAAGGSQPASGLSAPATGQLMGAVAPGGSLAAGGTTGGTGTATAPDGTTATGGGSRSRLVPANGAVGVTNTTVAIGYEYIESGDFSTASGGLGLQGTAVGNTREEAQAVIDYINSHGGVAGGRKLLGVPYKQNLQDDAPTHDQAACSDYTEDHHSFAAMSIDDGMNACLHNHHVVAIAGEFTRATAKQYPHDVFAPGKPESVRASAKLAETLHDYKYFDAGTKLGVIYDPPDKPAFEAAFVPTLRQFGVSVVDHAEISEGSSSLVADVQGAELKFASEGIDHVVILNSGLLALVFMQQAQSQHYHPRYGLWSGNQEAILQTQAFAEDQLPRSIGMGWDPALDVDQSHLEPNAAQKLCDAIMKARGFVAVSSLDHGLQLAYCATFFWAAEALNSATGLDTLSFQAAVEALGSPVESAAISYAESWRPGKHWGAGAVRMTAYDTGCSCYVYRSGTIPI